MFDKEEYLKSIDEAQKRCRVTICEFCEHVDRCPFREVVKVIYNYILPFPGFRAMMLFGVIFARKDSYPLSKYTINHERIHVVQAKECGGYLPYYLRYLSQWICYGYRNIPFEREAYDNGSNLEYLYEREPFAWKKYLNNEDAG